MAFKRFGRRRADPDRLASAMQQERAMLEPFMLSTGLTEAERLAVSALIDAVGPCAVLAVVKENPWLASERGVAVFRILTLTLQMLPLNLLLPLVEDRGAWLAQLVEAGVRPDKMRLPDD